LYCALASGGPGSYIPRPFDLADLYHTLVEKGRMVGYEVSQRFYEIGSPAGLEERRAYLQARAG
jgi:NDP-sugar pyrophosphorylase family protein